MDRTRVREALCDALVARGYDVAGDTVGLRNELYVRGAGDSAAALFEFKETAEQACVDMYGGQGRWLPHLPPRFAVLPVSESGAPAVEILTQVGLSVLSYEERPSGVAFLDLDGAIALFKSGDPGAN